MMELSSLWLPILIAAVAVFVASSLVHMVFRWHQSDFSRLPNEDAVRVALREGGAAPGQYMTPWCEGMKAMKEPANLRKFEEGPIATITLMKPGMPSMGGPLLRWFVLNLVVAAAVAAIALQTYGLGVDPHYAGHLAGLITFLTYGVGGVQQAIWMGRRWSSAAKDLLDALIYGTVTALVFMWLWPTVAAI
jgi:hypothetical protein